MGNEKAERIQTSILNSLEKKALVYLGERLPKWVTSDQLTFLGLLGAFVCALGFILSNINLNYLWLANLGLVINWYGDSLDGTLARIRKQQRPRYGFFIDHSLDSIAIIIMCIGAGLSPLFMFNIAMLVLIGYLTLSIYTYVTTIVNDSFRLTYGALGPTEFRLIFIILNIVYLYTPIREVNIDVCGYALGIYDIIAAVVAVIIAILWTVQFLKDKAILSKQDPLIKN